MGIHQSEAGRVIRPGHSSNVAATAARRPVALAALLALLGAAPLAALAAPPERSAEGPWAKGRILVMPKPGLSAEKMAKMLHGGKAKKIGGSNLHIVELPANASEKAVAALMANNPHFEFAELDMLVPPNLVSNDPYLGSAWHLMKIGAPVAWDSSQGSGVTIAILDSGVDAAHPDLSARLVPGWNFYENNSNTADVYGHGTKVAGAAAASTNNGVGVAGVAGQARIMPIRVTDTSGYGSLSAFASGLTYAADKGVRIANLSFGAAGNATVQSAAQYMKSKGGLVFVSAGNNNTDYGYAATTSLIAVSATDGNDAKASWSNFGNWVALSAPGTSIYSTVSGGGYGAVSGTSFSSPVSAGVAALVMAANPKLSSTDVEKILFTTALDLGAVGRDQVYGHGRIDATAAVLAALSTVSSADTQAPSVSIAAPLGSSTVSGLVPVNVSAADNIGVVKVELRVNGSIYATDTASPFAFSWDSTKIVNGSVSLETVAFDAAGNSAKSAAVAVNVLNTTTVTLTPAPAADTTAPTVSISNPTDGSTVGGTVSIAVLAADDRGSAGITQQLFIDGKLVKSATGTSLSYQWNTRKASSGAHSITTVARDAAGNTASRTVQVSR